MSHSRSVFVAAVMLLMSIPWPCSAQDNPLLRQLIQHAIEQDMLKHHSKETAWRGQTRKVHSAAVFPYTEETKSWVWLDEPAYPPTVRNLNVNVTRFEFVNGRLEFAVVAKAKAPFEAWGKVGEIQGTVAKGNADLAVIIEGNVDVDGDQPRTSASRLDGRFDFCWRLKYLQREK